MRRRYTLKGQLIAFNRANWLVAADLWSIACNTAATRLSLAKSVCPLQGEEEAPMSLTMTLVMLISGWLAVAAAMLWGVLRIARRHHHPAPSARVANIDKSSARHATSH